jgi:photosystem II stability/assembly factor-like uncharacterized protein
MKNLLPVFILLFLLTACQKPSCPDPVEVPDDTLTNPPEAEVRFINSWALKSSGISGNLVAVDFPTPTTGYISGINGVLYKTTDGGDSYQDISHMAGYDSYGLDFVSENTGYMINNNSNVDGNVFKTTDGGQNWQELTVPAHMWRCISFHDENIGFVGGGIINYSQDAAGKLFKTIDGGQNWTEVVISNLKIVRDIFFVNSSVLFITTDHARVYKSTDGGNSWTLLPHTLNTAINGVYLSPHTIYFKNLNEGYCLTNGTGAVGIGTFLSKTMDGGLTWSEITLPSSGYSTYNYYVSLLFTNANAGYLSGGNFVENKASILKTTDGGNTWAPMVINYPRLQQMHVVNDTLAYIVGMNSTVLKAVP